jgi:hypothetical protein
MSLDTPRAASMVSQVRRMSRSSKPFRASLALTIAADISVTTPDTVSDRIGLLPSLVKIEAVQGSATSNGDSCVVEWAQLC